MGTANGRKSIFVTGAASGIGKAIATRLAAEGACVIVADLDLVAFDLGVRLGAKDVGVHEGEMRDVEEVLHRP